jgi:branched-chain amino acid transport system substrate-binding protein
MAVEEVNAAGGIGGKKLKIVSFDTAGKLEQAVAAVRKLAEDDKVMAIIGPLVLANAVWHFRPNSDLVWS